MGLARLEFIINNEIGVHPRACLEYDDLPAPLKNKLDEKTRGYADARTFFREKMVEGVATIAAAFWPKPVIVRLSDFKSNEYRKLLGGERYEPDEENPMLGFRGASRYIAPDFRECFELECAAMRKVRDELGLTNVELMVPFVRTVGEARQVIELLKKNGLERGKNGLQDRDDVRAALQRHPGRGVPRAVRRLFHRLERPDPAHARPGSRFGPGGGELRRARRRR